MTEWIGQLTEYLSYPFVRYALMVGVLISLSASLLGVPLVLKRMSVIGDGLSHISFGALAVASVLKITGMLNMPFILAMTVIAAVILIRGGRRPLFRSDAAVAMLSVGALSAGYLLLNVFGASANVSGDVCTTLFGSTSILTLSVSDVWLCAGLSALVLTLFVLFYNKIFAVTFDAAFAEATGVRAALYDDALAVVAAAVIVLAMTLVGALLVSALIVFPAMSAMRVFHSFRSVTVCSALLAVVCAVTGILVSILAGTPVGATIVVFDIVAFLLFSIIGRIHTR